MSATANRRLYVPARILFAAGVLLALCLAALPALSVQAQSPEPGFDPLFYNWVRAIAVQPDARIVVGGYFNQVDESGTHRIVRLLPDGSVDPSFVGDADLPVLVVGLQPDGRMVVGGNFTQMNGQARAYIARLNADGTLDPGFDPGANENVRALALYPDGRVLIGGAFTTVAGQMRTRIARLSPSGGLDLDFHPGLDNAVLTVALQPDGKILIGGHFTICAGYSRNGIARLNPDGTTDTSFNPWAERPGDPDPISGTVRVVLVQPDGRILVGGDFSQFGRTTPQPAANIARLNPEGTLDPAFSASTDGEVYALALQADGRILVGGLFTTVNGEPRNGLALLNPNGSLVAGYDQNPIGHVYGVALQPDGKALVGGGDTLSDPAQPYFARLTAVGAATENLSLGDGGSTVTWMRDGTTPEVERVVFEANNGGGYSLLGAGSRISGGWRLGGLTLPRGQVQVRARGFYPSGLYAGSASIAESVIEAYFDPWPTTTTLVPSATSLAYGQPVTLTATVASPQGTPSGPVTFVIDGAEIDVALDADGVATYTATGLNAGSHQISALYRASGAYAASQSAPLQLTVAKAPTTVSLTTAPNPSKVGQPVSLIASVAAAGSPSGSVTFTVNGQPVATVSLDGAGVAAHTLTLDQGEYIISAQYEGNANLEGSVATPVQHTVQAAEAPPELAGVYLPLVRR